MTSRRTLLLQITATATTAAAATLTGVSRAVDPFVVADIHPGQLPGTWRFGLGRFSGNITFDADGSFSGQSFADGKQTDAFGGRWKITDLSFTPRLHWEFQTSKVLAAGAKDVDEIERLNQEFLILRTQKRQRHVYRRVKPQQQAQPAK
jgi:hypothetical protein